jgi:phosphoribulokinase
MHLFCDLNEGKKTYNENGGIFCPYKTLKNNSDNLLFLSSYNGIFGVEVDKPGLTISVEIVDGAIHTKTLNGLTMEEKKFIKD